MDGREICDLNNECVVLVSGSHNTHRVPFSTDI